MGFYRGEKFVELHSATRRLTHSAIVECRFRGSHLENWDQFELACIIPMDHFKI